MNNQSLEKRALVFSIIGAGVLTVLGVYFAFVIGDRDQDILGARDNGLATLAVSYGFGSREELIAAEPDHIVDHSREITPFLNPRKPVPGAAA